MHIGLVPLRTSLEVPIRDIYRGLCIRTNWIIWWIFWKFTWHWLPVKTGFPFCFSKDLQYLFCHNLVPLWWQMNSIPIKHQTNKWKERQIWTFSLRQNMATVCVLTWSKHLTSHPFAGVQTKDQWPSHSAHGTAPNTLQNIFDRIHLSFLTPPVLCWFQSNH